MAQAIISHPVLSCAAARDLEARLLGGDEAREWAAMRAAGRAVAGAVLRDFAEIGPLPSRGRVLVLAGKGHNGGDALLAAAALLERCPGWSADVALVHGGRGLRPLAQRAWQGLAEAFPGRVALVLTAGEGVGRPAEGARGGYAVALDGVFGFQYRPPLDARSAAALRWANGLDVAMRVAVDLPSGWEGAEAFRADWTYATGSLKEPLLAMANAGRIRYLDLGFFAGSPGAADAAAAAAPGTKGGRGAALRVALGENLRPLAGWRAPRSDKRTYGHVAVLGGSRRYPGAILMAVEAALRSGAGLVTAFVPESLVAAAAAQLPEAIWTGWPETPDGGLALEGLGLWREAVERFSAGLIGPGLGRERETLALAAEIVGVARQPFVIDADALQPAVVGARAREGKGVVAGARVLTPHAGELARLAEGRELQDYARETGAVVVAKGPVTRIAAGDAAWVVCAGGPVLARGGSGDILAGLTAGLLAGAPDDPAGAAVRGALWHGLAADALARARGPVAVRTTELLDFLPEALRGIDGGSGGA